MFSIDCVDIGSFRSFEGDHHFELPTSPGLYHLTGDNRLNPRLGANATGKSTLLDAIFWCLYGRTTRGLKAADIVTWGKKSCTVSVVLKIGNEDFVVTRTQNPNSLRIESDKGGNRVIDQKELTKTLRLTPDQFLVAVLMPQFGESFFDLGPAEKLNLFSQILNLDFWSNKSDDAREIARAVKLDLDGAAQAVSASQGAIDALTMSLSDLHKQREAWEGTQLEQIKKCDTEVRNLLAEKPKYERSLETAKKCLTVAKKKEDKFTEEFTKITKKINELTESTAKGRSEAAVLEREISLLEKQLASADGLAAKCPVCLQKVDKSHLADEKRKISKQIQELTTKMEAVFAENSKAEKVFCKSVTERAAIQADINSVLKNMQDFVREIQIIEHNLANFTTSAQLWKDRLKVEKERVNPHELIIASTGNKLTAERLKQKNLLKRVDTLTNEHAQVEFWINGFKRLRLFIIESTLRELEIEVNNNLSSLGLSDWRVEFDVERENKKGGVTKGFTVMVLGPGHKQPVPLAAWSGGETQRLRMAGDLGLANLIMEQAGLRNTIEMYDEPSRHLSQAGLTDLAETLADRAEETGRRILMIDHNNLDFGGFAGTITVVKDEKGSHIKEV